MLQQPVMHQDGRRGVIITSIPENIMCHNHDNRFPLSVKHLRKKRVFDESPTKTSPHNMAGYQNIVSSNLFNPLTADA